MPVIHLHCDLPILEETLDRIPETKVTLEDVRTLDGQGAHFVLWASGPDRRSFEDAARSDPTVRGVTCLVAGDEWGLFRTEFVEDGTGLSDIYGSIVDGNGIILAARGSTHGWSFQLFFPDRAAVSRCYDRCCRSGLDPLVQSLSAKDTSVKPDEYGLTGPQREVLTTAAKAGYFSVPKEISLIGLADELGVSDQATSERLRRGMDTLIRNTLGNTEEAY